MKSKLALFVIAISLSWVAAAQPSTYYLWKNTVTGKTACEPESLGVNWIKVGGPFQDANCSIPMPQ
ncbi:MAG: hypothetical protein IH627_11515 [Rubrivivax sp.]|nr:hypothetical protein [Rubrivivax sp.]